MSRRGVSLKMFCEDFNGKPERIQGYCALFNTPSFVKFENGLPEILAPGCFNEFIKSGRKPYLGYNHAKYLAMPDDVDFWIDAHGLAFAAANIRRDEDNEKIIMGIRCGHIATCSFKYRPAIDARTLEDVPGFGPAWVIWDIDEVLEFGPAQSAVFDKTACWLSSSNPMKLTANQYLYREKWQQGYGAYLEAKGREIERRWSLR